MFHEKVVRVVRDPGALGHHVVRLTVPKLVRGDVVHTILKAHQISVRVQPLLESTVVKHARTLLQHTRFESVILHLILQPHTFVALLFVILDHVVIHVDHLLSVIGSHFVKVFGQILRYLVHQNVSTRHFLPSVVIKVVPLVRLFRIDGSVNVAVFAVHDGRDVVVRAAVDAVL